MNRSRLVKVIINIMGSYYGSLEPIISDCNIIFTSKFWSLLNYFPGINRRLSTTLLSQINSQTEKPNDIMEAYLQCFINGEKKHLAKLLLIGEFAYHKVENMTTSHIPFELNCGYCFCVFFEDNANSRFSSRSSEELAKKIKDLIYICQQNLLHT